MLGLCLVSVSLRASENFLAMNTYYFCNQKKVATPFSFIKKYKNNIDGGVSNSRRPREKATV
jgi:hypothetical protein